MQIAEKTIEELEAVRLTTQFKDKMAVHCQPRAVVE